MARGRAGGLGPLRARLRGAPDSVAAPRLSRALAERGLAVLRYIADRCPVHRTLESEVEVRTRLEERAGWEEGIPAGG